MAEDKCFMDIGFLKHNKNTCIDEILRLMGKFGCSNEERKALDDELCVWLADVWAKKTNSSIITYHRINGKIVEHPDEEDKKAAFFIIAMTNFFDKTPFQASRQEIYAGFYSSSCMEQAVIDIQDEKKKFFRWNGVLFSADKEQLIRELKLHVASITLQEFALMTSYDLSEKKRTYNQAIRDLANMSYPEDWSFKGRNDYSILKNYLEYTFMKLYSESKIFPCINGGKYFNTGLFTPDYKKIYAVFKRNPNGDERMFFEGFFSEDKVARFGIKSRDDDRADYFTQPAMLIFNPSLPIDLETNREHINVERFDRWLEGVSPADAQALRSMNEEKRRDTLYECIDRAKCEIQANYKAAVPHYYINKRVASEGKIQLLIPLRFRNRDQAFIALVLDVITDDKITEDGSRISVPVSYKASTCLTLDQAYKNARLIVRPSVEWLKPQDIAPMTHEE